ncbi:MAG: protein kinase [candidate division Zixibacteria bacterium]|nr:protein kinase [candidate division Zixibacteria bacterium]MBU1470807.1 protein kinase [candidate division Zixibacteria bacterium]MBU2624678.1 protein kinase [candidate division Zixibacteria bacterium]
MSEGKIGKYELIEKRGEGGFGVLYKAMDSMIDRVVALKVLHPQYASNERLSAWFRREAKAMARLSHPNIVIIHNFEIEGDRHFIVMEYVEGTDLDEELKAGHAFEIDDAIRITTQMVDAFGYAHENGIIHRDIKPSNVMLDTSRRVKITDFGIAKILGDSKLTKTGTGVGSIHYMSPEQVEGNPVDKRTDIYSLGITLYQMLVGKVPFADDSEFVVMRAHLDQPPVPPSELRSDIPAELNRIVLKMLEKKPDDRYDSMGAIARDLSGLGMGAPSTPVAAERASHSDDTMPVTPVWQAEPVSMPESPTPARKSHVKPLLFGSIGLISIAILVYIFILSGGEEHDTSIDEAIQPVAELPIAPSEMVATPISTDKIDLSWTDNSNYEVGFRIFRGTAADSVVELIATLGTDVVSMQDTGLSARTTYFYRAHSFSADGVSEEYASVSATTPGPTPPPVVGKGKLLIEVSPYDYRSKPTIGFGGKTLEFDNNPFEIGGIKKGWHRVSVHFQDKSFFEDIYVDNNTQYRTYRFNGASGRVSIGAEFIGLDQQPWAEIVVDGKPIESGTPTAIDLVEGPHLILARKDGFETVGDSKIVNVKAGDNATVNFKLRRK